MRTLKNIRLRMLALTGIAGVLLFISRLFNNDHIGWFGLLILAPFILYFIFDFIQSGEADVSSKKPLREFMAGADKIIVNIEDYTFNNTENIFEDSVSGEFYSGIAPGLEKNDGTYLKFNLRYDDKTLSYDLFVEKDPEELKRLLSTQKETWLYINRSDAEAYYLDLDFLLK